MEIVTVQTPSGGKISNRDEYLGWVREQVDKIERILHVKVEPKSIGYECEYTEQDGILYLRRSDADDTSPEFFGPADNDKAREIDAPEVMCICGNVNFTLRYGCYELRARCTRCGTECDVYTG